MPVSAVQIDGGFLLFDIARCHLQTTDRLRQFGQAERGRVLRFAVIDVTFLQIDRTKCSLSVVGVHFAGEDGRRDVTNAVDLFRFARCLGKDLS